MLISIIIGITLFLTRKSADKTNAKLDNRIFSQVGLRIYKQILKKEF